MRPPETGLCSRLRLARLALLVIALLVMPGIAVAAEGSAAKPPPSMFSGSVWNAIWALSIFVLLLIVLGKFAWKPVAKVLEDRERTVAATIAEAELTRDQAMKLLAEYQKRLDQAQADAQRLLSQTQSEAEKVKQQVVAQARQEADAARVRAVGQIEASKNEALSAIFEQAATLATRAAGHILEREMRPEDHQRLVEQTLAEMSQTHTRN